MEQQKLDLREMINKATQGDCKDCNKECQSGKATLKITIEMIGCLAKDAKEPIVIEGAQQMILITGDDVGTSQHNHCSTQFLIEGHAILLSEMLDQMSESRRLSKAVQMMEDMGPLGAILGAGLGRRRR